MLRAPNEPLPGQPVTASDHAALIHYIKQITPRRSVGQVRRMGSGGYTTRNIAPPVYPPSPASGSATFNPFQKISLKSIGGDLTGASGYTLTLQPGVINGNIFPRVGDTFMWQMVGTITTVGGVSTTTYAFPTLTVHKGDRVYLKATIAAGLITDAIIEAGTPPAETDEITSQILGTCDTHTGAWTQLVTGNLTYKATTAYFNAGTRLINHVWGRFPTA